MLAADRLETEDHLTILHCRAYAAHHEAVAAPGGTADGAPDGTPERFEAEVGASERAADGYGNAARVAGALQMRADLAARRGDFEQAEAGLLRALDLLETAGRPWRAPRALGLLGQVKLVQGKPADAVPLLHRALAETARWGDEAFPVAPTYAMLGHACAHTGDHTGAVRALSEAAARYDRAGAVQDAAETRLQLAGILDDTGQEADAVAVLESVLRGGDTAAIDERLVAQVRMNLGRGLAALGEHREAAEEFLHLADTVADWEDQDIHTTVACEATTALAAAGHWEAVDAARLRALASHERAPRPDQVAAMLRDVARLTVEAEGAAGLDAALERLAEAEAVRDRAEADGHPVVSCYVTGAVHYERSRALAIAERSEEALAAAELAISGYEAGGPAGERPRAEAVRIAALLEGQTLGRTDAARERLAAAVQRCAGPDLADVREILGSLRERLAAPPRA